MKTAAPTSFHRHLSRLGLLPDKAVRLAAPAAIGLEAGWGLALIVLLLSGVLLPFTAVALVLLTGLTWWSVSSGKTEDCGCYGGFITPSIGQTLGLNAIYLLLILVGWANMPQTGPDSLWKTGVVVIGIVVVGATAEYALRSEFSTDVPLFTPSPLKIGRRWKPRWAGTAKSRADADQIVSYLGPNCPYCQRWVRVLNVIHESPDLPPVTAIFGAAPEAIDAFVREYEVRFPIATISQGLMGRLAPGVPTTVLVEHGVIHDVWTGVMSPEFLEQFKRAFFPAAVEQARSSGRVASSAPASTA